MIFLLLLLAHLIADFWLQSDYMVKDKLKYLRKHLLHHFLTTGIALIIIWGSLYEFQNVMQYFIFPLIFIITTHLLIDLLKIKLGDTVTTKSDSLKKLGFFLLDQVLHGMTLAIVCILFFHLKIDEMATNLLNLFGTSSLSPLNTSLFLIIIFILATSVSGHIVKYIVGSLPSEFANFEGELTLKNRMQNVKEISHSNLENSFTEEYHYFTYSSPLRSRGKLIGYIERLIVIVLTFIGAYQSIAFIIAAKSIARFKQLDDRNWAEYFLLGTLSSIFIGLVIGLFVQKIIT